jgi:hypothetical protein
MRLAPLAAALGIVLACGDLPHDNPHDPQAPSDTKGKATLAGHVSLEPRGAIAAAPTEILVSVAGQSWSAVTDEDGSYHIAGVPVGSWTVQFSRYGWDRTTVPVVVTLDTVGTQVELPDVVMDVSRGSIAGSIALDREALAAGVSVSVAGEDEFQATAVTAPDGSYLLSGLPVGSYSLRASKVGFRDGTVTGVEVSASGVTAIDPLTLAIFPGAFSGSVLVSGAQTSGGVTVRASGMTLNGTAWEETTQNRDDGSYLFSGLPGGSYTVTFERAGYATATTAGSIIPGGVTELGPVTLLPETGAASGLAVLEGAADSSGTLVTLQPDLSSPPVASAITDAAGGWHMDTAPVGTFQLVYTPRKGWQAGTGSMTVLAHRLQQAASVSLAAIPGRLHGRVLAEGIAAGGLGATTIRVEGTNLSTATLDDGSWTLTGVASWAMTVVYERAGYDTQRVQVVGEPGGDLALADATLARSRGGVSGTVVLSAGTVTGFPVGSDRSGIVVELAGGDVQVPAAVTDAAGNYRFEGVPVSPTGGTYTLTARLDSYRPGGPVPVTVAAGATATAPSITLAVDPGAITGTVQLWDNVAGIGANASSAGATVTVTGTAFNGAAWSASATTGDSGAFSVANLPRGSYDVVVTSTGRTCGAFTRASVTQGATAAAGTLRCTDALAPGAVILGTPTRLDGTPLAGYTNERTVFVPIAVQATDPTVPTSNLRGYQIAVGLAPDWSSAILVSGPPTALGFTVAPNARTVLWARAMDWAGNPGPVASIEMVQDEDPPSAPAIATPRKAVNSTITSVTLSGGEADPNFLGYQGCTTVVPATSTCSAWASCGFATKTASFAVSLSANQRTCVYARTVDRAGNVSDASVEDVLSDIEPPSPPSFVPTYDPYQLTVRAPWVDFFVAGAATDSAAGNAPWQGIAWIEVDTGMGFQPLCPQPACQTEAGAWSPCGDCHCADPRLRCDGTRFVGIRAMLSEGTATNVAFRAVDAAGNVGAGVSQQVFAERTSSVVASSALIEAEPVIRGSLVGYREAATQTGPFTLKLVDLGPDRRLDASDRTCTLTSLPAYLSTAAPISDKLVLFPVENGEAQIGMRRPGPDGRFCTSDDVPGTLVRDSSGATIRYVAGSGETAVYAVQQGDTTFSVRVRTPGVDGLLGTSDDPATITLTTGSGLLVGLAMGGKAILTQHCSNPSSGCSNYVTRVYNAGSSGWSSGVTTFDLPNGSRPGLSSDGRTITWTDRSSIYVRTAGNDGLFGTSDDTLASRFVPEGVQVSDLVVDETHVAGTGIVAGSPTTPSREVIPHWWAGPDGLWGTADDVVENLYPSDAWRTEPSLHGGTLVFSQANDLALVDLTTVRWEVARPQGLFSALSTDANGTLFYVASPNLIARTRAGAESAGPWPGYWAATGQDLVTVEGRAVRGYTVDGAGQYFTSSAPSSTLYTASDSVSLFYLTAVSGKAMVLEFPNSSGALAHYRILEPGGGGTLHGAVSAVDPYPAGVSRDSARPPAITARQAFFSYDSTMAVLGAGADGTFGTADDTGPTTMVHAQGSSATAGGTIARPYVVASDELMLFAEGGGATYLRDPGSNGLYDLNGDRQRVISPRALTKMAVAGHWAAWVDVGADGGDQVFVVNGYDGVPKQITQHYSQKSGLAIDPSGKAYWIDTVMFPAAVMAYVP